MIKVYILKEYQSLTTSFMVNGKQLFVDFEGGTRHGLTTRGMLTTSDKKLQDAIENDPSYDILFMLDEARTKMANGSVVADKGGDAGNGDDGYTVVEGISNAQEAKEYILKVHTQYSTDDVANVEKLKSIMEELKIRFNPYKPR